jgi:hypothetical protein
VRGLLRAGILVCLGCTVEVESGPGAPGAPDAPAAPRADAPPLTSIDAPPAGAADGPAGSTTGDRCPIATAIGARPTTVMGNLEDAADDYDPPSGCSTDGVEVVYSISLPTPQAVGVRVASADFSGHYYVDTQCPPVDPNACVGFSAGSTTGAVSTTYPAGTVYVIIEREAGVGGSFELDFE